jgi:hypothetical protein
MVIVILLDKNVKSKAHTMEIDYKMFKLSPQNVALTVIILILTLALYIKFW